MKRGTVILLHEQALLPTFYYDCTYQPYFWKLLLSQLVRDGFIVPGPSADIYHKPASSGDANEECGESC